MKHFLLAMIGGMIVVWLVDAKADQYTDSRICYNNERYASGAYKRNAKVPRAYQMVVPCPSTGLETGACPGWSVDHVRPISRCGCDSVDNVQWLKNTIKSCAGTECKDRWELFIYSCKQGN